MRKPLTPTSGRTSQRFVSDRRKRNTFDDMEGWRYADYAATYDSHAYIRYVSDNKAIKRCRAVLDLLERRAAI